MFYLFLYDQEDRILKTEIWPHKSCKDKLYYELYQPDSYSITMYKRWPDRQQRKRGYKKGQPNQPTNQKN